MVIRSRPCIGEGGQRVVTFRTHSKHHIVFFYRIPSLPSRVSRQTC